ncbi:MAG: glycosyltransferase family 9 protein [Bacteroidales bacterium]|jgi:heptosyltransferase-2|nr:glycosyltransferase family 9 protein [Bacteroidales bacterium]
MDKKGKKILIIHTAFLGDIILSTPLLSKISHYYTDCKIYYLTTPLGAEILQHHPHIEHFIIYDKRGKDKGFRGWLRILKQIKKEHFDIVFALHRYLKTTLFAYFSNAYIRIGYNIAFLNKLFTKRVIYVKKKHEVERLLSFVEPIDDPDYSIALFPDNADFQIVQQWLSADFNGKRITIAPESQWFTKQWLWEYFQILVEKLSKIENLQIVIVGQKKDNLFSNSKNIIDLRGKTSLSQWMAVIAMSDVLVSNDSASVHIASAFPSVKIHAIFGPTIKEFGFYPWSQNSVIHEVSGLPCRPCGIHGSNRCKKKHFKCMKNILPQTVFDAICTSLKI